MALATKKVKGFYWLEWETITMLSISFCCWIGRTWSTLSHLNTDHRQSHSEKKGFTCWCSFHICFTWQEFNWKFQQPSKQQPSKGKGAHFCNDNGSFFRQWNMAGNLIQVEHKWNPNSAALSNQNEYWGAFFSSSRHTIPNRQIVRTLCGTATYFATLFAIVNFKQHPFDSHISLYLLVSTVAFELKGAICLQVPLTYCIFFHHCCSFLFRGSVRKKWNGQIWILRKL